MHVPCWIGYPKTDSATDAQPWGYGRESFVAIGFGRGGTNGPRLTSWLVAEASLAKHGRI